MEIADVDFNGADPREAVVALHGDIDLSAREDLRDVLHTVIHADGVGTVVVDLSRVSFMDSTGLHVLVTAHQQAQRSGVGLRVAGATGVARRVLAVTGVLGLLTGEPDPGPDEPLAPYHPAPGPRR